jgi:biopolymer transport protein ExbD
MPKKLPEVNASSMADIAFLLLIFFLVTTSIETDTGLPVRLPAWSDEKPEAEEFNKRNVYSILINSSDQLLVRGKQASIATLRENTKEFIMNPSKRSDLAIAPNEAVVMLKNDRGTSYDMYLHVYNELKGAYKELWDEAANQLYGRNYDLLSKENRKEVRKRIPLVISEAEPVEFGQE